MQKFRQNLIAFEKPGILTENLKTLTSPNYPRVQYFLHTFPTYQCLQKDVRDFFYFVWILSYLKKLKKLDLYYTLDFYIFINNSSTKQNKKDPEHVFVEIVK